MRVLADGRIALTADELAGRLGLGLGAVAALLEQEVARGAVERLGGNLVALDAEFERRHGVALRELEPECCGGGCSRCERRRSA